MAGISYPDFLGIDPYFKINSLLLAAALSLRTKNAVSLGSLKYKSLIFLESPDGIWVRRVLYVLYVIGAGEKAFFSVEVITGAATSSSTTLAAFKQFRQNAGDGSARVAANSKKNLMNNRYCL